MEAGGCTALGMYLMPLDGTPYNGSRGKYGVYFTITEKGHKM